MPIRTPVYEHILGANKRYASRFEDGGLPAAPALRLAVITCMDARIDPLAALGLRPGEAHVIRNAGALATDDVIRSLVISQRLLGTEEVAVIGHTDCGMASFRDEEVRDRLVHETGADVDLPLLPFEDVGASVARQVEAIRAHPWTKDVAVHAFVFEVETGRLREVG